MVEPEAADGTRPTPAGTEAIGRGLAGAAILIMFGNLLSRVLGMVREQLAAGLFGTGDEIAAFQIADNVQTLLFDLVMSGMLEAALIPVLVLWTADERMRAELRHVAGALLGLVSVVVGIAVILGVIFAPVVVDLMTRLGGDDSRGPETTALTVSLVRIVLPAVLFLGLATVMMSVLYAFHRVTAPALGLAARNAAVVIAMVVLHQRLGVKSMAIGVVIGAVLIALIQLPPLIKIGAMPTPNLHLRHPGVRQVLRLQAPIFAGLLVSTLAVIVDRNLAWRAQIEALGAMRYATTLVQFLLGLIAAAISLAALPSLAGHHGRGDENAFRETLERALAMVTVLIVPATLTLAALAVPTVDLLFKHGATGERGARFIVIALLGYLPGTLCAAYDQVLIYSFYARKNTLLPVLVGIGATGIYLSIALTAGRRYGMIGLVVANSAQFAAHLAIMSVLLRRTLGRSEWPRLRAAVVKCGVAGVLMAGSALLFWQLLEALLPSRRAEIATLIQEAVLVLLPAAAAGAVYVALLHRWQVDELTILRRATIGRVLPRFAG